MWVRARKVLAAILEPRPAPPAPTPAERAEDVQEQLDAEYQALVASRHAAFIAQLLRDGYVWPSGASPGLQEHRDRLRQARGEGRW
jgi:hypothetical protein